MNWLNISSIKIWWIRLFCLLVLGIPALSGWPLNSLAHSVDALLPFELETAGEIANVLSWTLYACVVWLVIFSSVGAQKFLEYMAAAFIVGLTTALLGSVMRKAFPLLAGSASGDEISLKMVTLLLIIITVVPYTLLLVNSFSARAMISRLASATGKRKELGLHLALVLRVFQHTGEVIFNLMDIWAEEHPEKIFPRHRRDWKAKWYSPANMLAWVWSAVFAWIYATMVHTFEPIPGMVDEVAKINQYRR